VKIKFKNPPINELIIGAYFNPPLIELRAEHIGLFWDKIRDQFPKISQQSPIVGQGEATDELLSAGSDEIYPLPRFWFVQDDESMLLQLQRNAFLLNWRKREKVYPHFESIKQDFDRLYGLFSDFVDQQLKISLIVEMRELTYTNLVKAGPHWSGPDDIPSIIPSFRAPGVGNKSPLAAVLQTTTWEIAKDMRLAVKIQSGTEIKTQLSVLLFELSAKGSPAAETKTEIDRWYDRAHECTGKAFISMTSDKIRNNVWLPDRNVR
jgi:uncharacterized protein (TIGR04255 family)